MNKICTITASQLSENDFDIELGATVSEILSSFEVEPTKYIGVRVNNEYKPMDYPIHKNSIVEFVDCNDYEGERIYRRTLVLLLNMAVKKVFPNAVLKMRFFTPGGFNFEVEGFDSLVDYSVDLNYEMQKIINGAYPIDSKQYHFEDAENLFKEHNHIDKIRLMGTRRNLYYTVVRCQDEVGHFYGTVAQNTSVITNFNIIKIRNTYIISHKNTKSKGTWDDYTRSNWLYDSINDQKNLIDRLGVNNVSSLNEKIQDGSSKELIKIAEAQQAKSFTRLSDAFYENYLGGARIILISGPSSSGKTTFSFKLRIMLKTFGIDSYVLSMDDYFINREDIPVGSDGTRDFERFENVDLNLFQSHVKALLANETIDLPKYDFGEGVRVKSGKKLSIKDGSVILVEGIHALNPNLTEGIDKSKIFKIFISPLTSVSMDNSIIFSTDDNRLIRRIIRDNSFRAYSATNTLKQWKSVRDGERKNIFPYQDQADIFFNTSLYYELNVLKPYIVKLLVEVPNSEPVYAEAKRLLSLMEVFLPIDIQEVPSDSLIREFVGGSSFDY